MLVMLNDCKLVGSTCEVSKWMSKLRLFKSLELISSSSIVRVVKLQSCFKLKNSRLGYPYRGMVS